jgi:hypothetical protein
MPFFIIQQIFIFKCPGKVDFLIVNSSEIFANEQFLENIIVCFLLNSSEFVEQFFVMYSLSAIFNKGKLNLLTFGMHCQFSNLVSPQIRYYVLVH